MIERTQQHLQVDNGPVREHFFLHAKMWSVSTGL